MLPKLEENVAIKNLNKKVHCEHEYAEKTWICGKCGYQITSDLLGKVGETGWGKIRGTTV